MGAVTKIGKNFQANPFDGSHGGLGAPPFNPQAFDQKQLVQGQASLLGSAPAGTPDLSDPAIQARRKSQMLDSLLKQGRQSSFLTGLDGSPNPPTLGTKSLLGQ